MLVLFTLIPLTTSLIAFSILAGFKLTSSVEENIKEELEMAASSLKEYYEYDLINDNDLVDGFISYDTEYIDRMNEVGIDFTLFNKDVRFMTTIKDSSGKRIEGTKASSTVWETVSKGNSYYDDDVIINGIDYYVYYLPLGNGNNVLGMAFSGKPATQVEKAERQLYIFLFAGSVIFEMLFLALALLISKKISTPLSKIAQNIGEIAGGDTNVEINASTHIQETSTLVEAADKLGNVLRNSIGEIKNGTSKLKNAVYNTTELAKSSNEGAVQIKDSVENLTSSTNMLAQNVEKVNSGMIDMGSMVDDIVESTSALNNAASDMSAINMDAAKSIESMAEGSKVTAHAVDEITQSVKETNESIEKISDMVEIITEIASQTNLLSLNASIEAARAGEAGKGFGVVAGEIKRLAEQSDNSANDIKDIVKEILVQSERLVTKSEDVRNAITEEQTILVNTRQKFNKLAKNIETSVKEISSVSEKTDNLGRIKTDIANAVQDLSAISEENAATNAQVNEAVSSVASNIAEVSRDCLVMEENAQTLESATAYFT